MEGGGCLVHYSLVVSQCQIEPADSSNCWPFSFHNYLPHSIKPRAQATDKKLATQLDKIIGESVIVHAHLFAD